MNNLRQLFLRSIAFSLVVLLLLAAATGFSVIGASAWVSANQQANDLEGSYTTLAVRIPESPRQQALQSDVLPPDEDRIHRTAEHAPSVQSAAHCGFLSAKLNNAKGLSSASLEKAHYNRDFERFTSSCAVLAVKCLSVQDQSVQSHFDESHQANVVSSLLYDAEFEVLACPALHPAYGDLTGRKIHIGSPLATPDGKIPFEAGKTYLFRGFFEDYPTEYGWLNKTEMGWYILDEERSSPDAPYFQTLHFSLPPINGLFNPVFDEPSPIPNMTLNEILPINQPSDTQNPLYYITTPKNSLPFYAEYTGDWNDFLETEQGWVWKEVLIPWANMNQNSAPVLLTDNLSSVYNFNIGEASVLKGRTFTPEEYQQGRKVCMVSTAFADYNDLSVGDTLSVSYYKSDLVRGQIQFSIPYGAPTDDNAPSDNWQYIYQRLPLIEENNLNQTEDLEIIGIYTAPAFRANQNDFPTDAVFVPKASVSGAENYEYRDVPWLNTLVLKNGSIDAFEQYMTDQGLPGFYLFEDMGYTDAAASLTALAENAKRLFVVGAAAFALAAFVFLYLCIRKLSGTVLNMRRIGVSKKQVWFESFGVLALWSGLAIAVGTLLGAGLYQIVIQQLFSNNLVLDLRTLIVWPFLLFAVLLVLELFAAIQLANRSLMKRK